MRSLRVSVGVLLAAASILARPASGQIVVPEPLEPWRDWVLHGEEHRACPILNGNAGDRPGSYVCAWPGRLGIEVGAGRADFEIAWTLYAETWVPLPGGAERWPAEIRVDGTSQPVVDRDGRPTLRLPPGMHRVTGTLVWQTRPASIEVPREIGLVALRLDGADVANPELDAGTLWLGLRPDDAVEQDRLDIVVHRRLADGIPIAAETVVDLDIAGQSRELRLAGALLDGFVGESLETDLPAALDPDGVLRVQVRPGRWQVVLKAHARAMPEAITLAAAVAPWPADEIWSFDPAPRLRVAAIEGVAAVDADRSGVPGAWRNLPSYAVNAGDTVRIVERSRNDAAEPNRLGLRRDLWLDFDGGAFTARDIVTGEMRSVWRLDMTAPYTMTMAAIGDENLLITVGDEPATQGVELRAARVGLTTTARLPRGGALPVTGYVEPFDEAATTLHAPPGYRLLAAPGASVAAGAWFDAWRLLDIFLVLVIVAACWRLFGPLAGVLALGALVLTYHEPWAPRWAWLNLLVAIALARVAPVGRLRTLGRRYRWLSFAALAVLLVPFAALQLRAVVFPQLERPRLERGLAAAPGSRLDALLSNVQQGRVASAGIEALRREAPPEALEEVVVSGSRIERAVSRYVPGALVQTGPGLPDWSWNRYELRFAGPVDTGQTYRLLLLGPWAVALWRVASVGAALALLLALLRPGLRLPGVLRPHSSAAVVLALAVGAAAWPGPGFAQAPSEFPPPALLEELKRRLTEPAPCRPRCAELTEARVTIDGTALSIDLEFAAQDGVAVPVPTVPSTWRPDSIRVDGAEVGFLYRDGEERSWLRIEPGVHRVALAGALPPGNSLTLPFPLPPRRIGVDAAGWDVAGVVAGRLPSGTLELNRQAAEEDEGETLSGTVFPPYVRVTRNVVFDLDWSVRTRVERVAPVDGAFTLQVALLPDEAVITPGIESSGGRATAAFVTGQRAVEWESRLPTGNALSLTAAAGEPWSETWQFTVGQIWHADYAGLPATPPEVFDSSFYTPEYYPRPGETLTVTVARPAPAGGDTIAIDAVDYERSVGARVSTSRLYFEYRATRGMEHAITLPQGSELDSVGIDGEPVPLRLDGNRLGIPITPGGHNVEIAWRSDEGVKAGSGLPPVELGGGASNILARLDLPADRWILLTFGPTLGPAVLYWPELIVFALAAFVLGRVPLSPLRTREWLLLGLGLSTFAWPVLFLFIVWAFVMSWRGRSELTLPAPWFNALQVGLALLTAAALLALLGAIPTGLLGQPNMQVVSPVGLGSLSWYLDRTVAATPSAGVVSVSLWFYKGAMLAWSLWLSFALLRWLPWAWRAFTHGGHWRGRVKSGAASS